MPPSWEKETLRALLYVTTFGGRILTFTAFWLPSAGSNEAFNLTYELSAFVLLKYVSVE